MPAVIAKYRITAVVMVCTIDQPNTNGNGKFIKYGIALISGMRYKIT